MTTLEGNLETIKLGNVAKVGGLVVGSGSDCHAEVSAEHGSGCTNDKGKHGEGELVFRAPGHINGAKHDDGEEGNED